MWRCPFARQRFTVNLFGRHRDLDPHGRQIIIVVPFAVRARARRQPAELACDFQHPRDVGEARSHLFALHVGIQPGLRSGDGSLVHHPVRFTKLLLPLVTLPPPAEKSSGPIAFHINSASL